MRVLLVNDLPPGPGSGVEVHLDRLAAGLRAAGDDVELFAGEVVHRGAARVLDVWDPLARRRLAERAHAFRPDVVHHHHVVRELSSSVLGVPAGVPQVLTVHDFRLFGDPDAATGVLGAAKRAKAALDRSVARRRVDLAVAVSAPIAEALRHAGFADVVTIPPFADPPSRPPAPPGTSRCIAYAGRLAEDKGVGVLAAAWPAVLRSHPDARLAVAGSGPLALAIAALDQAEALGAVTADVVRDTFAEARVVVVPSVPSLRAEGTPTVAIEAALCGRPLVVSDDPGLREFVEASGGGLVVPGGEPAALADALARLLGDDELADRLGAAGARYTLEHHTVDAGVAALRAHYRRLVQR